MESNYPKPIFTAEEIEKFEIAIDNQIAKGFMQITISTNFLNDSIQRFSTYLNFYYPSGTFSKNANVRNYRVAKNGKKYFKKENW
jgi:hypothetical protein